MLTFTVLFISVATWISFTTTEPNKVDPINISYTNVYTQGMSGLHPLTGEALPSSIPYPFQGTAGDGIPDKIQYMIAIESTTELVDEALSQTDFRQWTDIRMDVWSFDDGQSGSSNSIVRNRTEHETYSRGQTTYIMGEIDLSFDLSQLTSLAYSAALLKDGVVLDTFYTEIVAGNPILTIESSVATNGMVSGDALASSVVTGQTALVFEGDFGVMKGRGPLNYEKFEIDPDNNRCTVTTSKQDGSWRAEVVFPGNMSQIESRIDHGGSMPGPSEVIVLIEPNIKEKATIRCRGGFPPVLPLPMLIHFYSVFYSWHGGEIKAYNESGRLERQPNEMNEGRGGLVMTDWQPGSGHIIATRTYKRRGKSKKVTFEEDTKLVLKWPE